MKLSSSGTALLCSPRSSLSTSSLLSHTSRLLHSSNHTSALSLHQFSLTAHTHAHMCAVSDLWSRNSLQIQHHVNVEVSQCYEAFLPALNLLPCGVCGGVCGWGGGCSPAQCLISASTWDWNSSVRYSYPCVCRWAVSDCDAMLALSGMPPP